MPARIISETEDGTIYSGEKLEEASRLRQSLIDRAISKEDAKSKGMKPLSHGFRVRRFDQCRLLQQMIDGLTNVEFVLVLKPGAPAGHSRLQGGVQISVWRK